MPLCVEYNSIRLEKFTYPFRMIISGSSQAGKTTLAKELLHNADLFGGQINNIIYYNLRDSDDIAINWHETLGIPVSYQKNLPTMLELSSMTPHTCLVIDDLYEESINSRTIDILFRILSRKKNLSVILVV